MPNLRRGLSEIEEEDKLYEVESEEAPLENNGLPFI